MGAWLAMATGLVAGGAHVVAGPDHLAALVPFAAGRPAFRVGAMWGLGHGLGVLALGAVGRLLHSVVDLETWSGRAELLVGILLVALGIATLWRSRVLVVHTHDHDHDLDDHRHVHVHVGDETVGTSTHASQGKHDRHVHGAFGFGVLHGAAGTGHLFGVLPSLALSTTNAALYLGAYLVSAVLTMGLFAMGVGRLTANPAHLPRALTAAGILSVAVGVFWIGGSVFA
jgi:hypothetical protein